MKPMHRPDRRSGLFMTSRAVRWTLPLAVACAGLIAAGPAAGQAAKDQPAAPRPGNSSCSTARRSTAGRRPTSSRRAT